MIMQEKALETRYRFGRHEEYEVLLADTIDLRRRAWALVYKIYAAKGYAKPQEDGLWYSPFDALPNTRTFLVVRGGKDVATLTLVADSPAGLPADELYHDELNGLRQQGCRCSEIISLVSEEGSIAQRMEVLKHMFRLAYLAARQLENGTDLVITVNPHHAGFYERKMLLERCGEEKRYGKVEGAPAVLLRLDLETVGERYRAWVNTPKEAFYRFFIDPETEEEAMAFLCVPRESIDECEWDGLFRECSEQTNSRNRFSEVGPASPKPRPGGDGPQLRGSRACPEGVKSSILVTYCSLLSKGTTGD